MAALLFLLFHFSSQGLWFFADDVGSVGIAFWIVTLLLLLLLIMKTSNLIWLGFLMVYGVDGGAPIAFLSDIGQ